MLQSVKGRILLGILFGGTAGASMTLTIFPYATIWFIETESYNLLNIVNLLIPTMLIWAMGGVLVGLKPGMQPGIMSLGGAGLLSGIVLGWVGAGNAHTAFVGAFAGLLYGAIGGAIIGRALETLVKK